MGPSSSRTSRASTIAARVSRLLTSAVENLLLDDETHGEVVVGEEDSLGTRQTSTAQAEVFSPTALKSGKKLGKSNSNMASIVEIVESEKEMLTKEDDKKDVDISNL